jgi:hypothetical protein
MRKIICLFLIPLSALAQERTYKQVITQTSSAIITDERNYKETLGLSKFGKDICIVDTELQIDDQWYDAHGEAGGTTKKESCKTAGILARQKLTNSIKPSIISSKAEIIYEENNNTKHIDGYKKGELVDVANLRVHPNLQKEFEYQKTKCKWFYDVRRQGEKGIKQYNLIACKLSDGWIVEDVFN